MCKISSSHPLRVINSKVNNLNSHEPNKLLQIVEKKHFLINQ